jgi:hypothetical protein
LGPNERLALRRHVDRYPAVEGPTGNDGFVKLVISITRRFIDLSYIIVIHWGSKKEDAMITLSLIAVVGTFFLLAACALSGPPAILR